MEGVGEKEHLTGGGEGGREGGGATNWLFIFF